MSETGTSPTPEAPKPAPPAQAPDGAELEPTVEEIDWKAKAREWERRAKENKNAADELAAIKESQKSEAEKVADRLAQAEKAAQDAQREALRFKIAAKHQIDDEDAELFLTGSDEETLTKQAQRLTGRSVDMKKQGNVAPNEGKTTPPPHADDMRSFTSELFGRALQE